MAKQFFFLAVFLSALLPAPSAFSANGKLTILKNIRKKIKPPRIVINLALRHNGTNLNLGSAEADHAAIVVAATGETQALHVRCVGFVRSEGIKALMFTMIYFTVAPNDHVIIPNFFNNKSFRMSIDFQDDTGQINYIGRDLLFDFPQ